MPCTADLERRDYLDFLPKRPQGTTKILGTSAFAGTKTPAALKFSSKGATTACVETPVNCPHCGQKRSGRASVPMPALYPAFFFVLEKTVKSAGNAVIPTFPMHWSHGLQGSLKRRYKHPSPTSINGYHTAKKLLSQSPAKRPTFAFADESGYNSALLKESHTTAHTAKQGAFRMGVVSLPSDRFAWFGNPAWPGGRKVYFAAFGPWPRVLPKNAESLRSSDALMRVAAPQASRPRWAA